MNIRDLVVVTVVAAGVLVACDDDPFAIRWEADPDTAQLFALSRPELNLASAFDFYGRTPLRLESPTTEDDWDLAVDTRDGQFVWLPPGSLGVPSDAGLATLEGETFLTLTRAPGDTARYVSDAPVPIEAGQVYVIRTRRVPGAFGTLCNYYGKIEALVVDVATGMISFQYDVSPVCNDRDLIPPD